MKGTTLSATLPIDLMPPMITMKTSPAVTRPPSHSGRPNNSFIPSAIALAWIELPVTSALNSVPRQKTTASQVNRGPRPIMM